MTKTQLATRIGVDLRSVSNYESGASIPTTETLAKLVLALGFPVEFFYGEDLEPIENVSFRSLARMTAKQRDMALSQGSLALWLSSWLEKKFELPPSNLPELRLEANDAEAAAASLRRIWNLGEMPIRNMVHLLESNGVRVFSLSIDAKEVDAFSFWSGDNPVVLLNTFKSAERSRFDAAHELAHLVLHRHGGPSSSRDAETQADNFASAFMMPKGSVDANAPRFPKVSDLIRLKKIWGTAASAVNYRLHKLKHMSDWHYRSLCIQLSSRGYHLHEPNGIKRESSVLLPKLLANLYEEDGLTRTAIANELSIPKSELDQLLCGLTISGIEGSRRGDPPIGNSSGLLLVK